MTSFRNASASDSAVYRSIYQIPQEDLYRSPLTGIRSSDTERDTSKWVFLKRLLEIEEAHDKRRKAKEKQERSLRQPTIKAIIAPDELQTEREDFDPMAKWFSGQVLTEAAVDALVTEPADAFSRDKQIHRLPPVSGQNTPVTSIPDQRKRQQHPPATCDLHVSSTLAEHKHAPVRLPTPTTPSSQCSDSDNRHADNHQQQLLAACNSPNSSHTIVQSVRASSPSPIMSLNHHTGNVRSSLENLQHTTSRPSTSTKPSRQLRLPPILLPKIYTVKPRPLKALEFPGPTKLPGPVTEKEWDELRDCRYIRNVRARQPLPRV